MRDMRSLSHCSLPPGCRLAAFHAAAPAAPFISSDERGARDSRDCDRLTHRPQVSPSQPPPPAVHVPSDGAGGLATLPPPPPPRRVRAAHHSSSR